MKPIFLCILTLLFLINQQSFSQTFCENAKTPSSIAGETEKLVYKKYGGKSKEEKNLHIALVRPNDRLPIKKRPLIIGVHGSGFVNSCLLEPCYLKYNEKILKPNFVAQGYITASVQYRLASPLDFVSLKIKEEKVRELSYQATQDLRDAIKFIFADAEKLGVDKENVFLIGTSAGAISVLHAGFLDNDEVPKDLLEKHGRLAAREKIRGIIGISGALDDLSYLGGGDKIPLMLAHGREDSIVPAEKGSYLKIKSFAPVYGGKAIFDEALKRGIEAKGFFYDFGHEIPRTFQTEIFKNAGDFVRSHLSCANAAKREE
jgi:predicted esterase